MIEKYFDHSCNEYDMKIVIQRIILVGLSISWCIIPAPWALGLKQVFQTVELDRPVHLTASWDGSGRIFLVEQEGRIQVIDRDPATGRTVSHVFLDIRKRVLSWGNEEGLLSLAFHPQYLQNGIFFVNYTVGLPRRTVISKFRALSQNPNQAMADSEVRILEIEQPYSNHNGGQLAFGPDGYLYIGMGDGGAGGDPLGNGQNLRTLHGAILRIDINRESGKTAYAVPEDNPFVGLQNILPEIWAYGLRNPWRFSFDRLTGELYAGDVGQNRYEEINLIEKGKNYGWNIMEGDHCYAPSFGCSQRGLQRPLVEYDHSEGYSVTGGFVYRGVAIPSLQGNYLYGDFGSGKIWGLTQINGRLRDLSLLMNTNINISSFGEDEAGEVYVVGLKGNIYQIVP